MVAIANQAKFLLRFFFFFFFDRSRCTNDTMSTYFSFFFGVNSMVLKYQSTRWLAYKKVSRHRFHFFFFGFLFWRFFLPLRAIINKEVKFLIIVQFLFFFKFMKCHKSINKIILNLNSFQL